MSGEYEVEVNKALAAQWELSRVAASAWPAFDAATGEMEINAEFEALMESAEFKAALDALPEGPEIKAKLDALPGGAEIKASINVLAQMPTGVQQAVDAAMGGMEIKAAIDAVVQTMMAQGVRYPERVVMYLEEGSRETLDELAAADHLSLGAYLRRLVMAHVERKRKARAS